MLTSTSRSGWAILCSIHLLLFCLHPTFSAHFLFHNIVLFFKNDQIHSLDEEKKFTHAFKQVSEAFLWWEIERPTNSNVLRLNNVKPLHKVSFNYRKKSDFQQFSTLRRLSPHSADNFSISAHGFTIVSKVDVEIPRCFAKVFLWSLNYCQIHLKC